MRFRLKAFGLHLTGSACALTLILGGLYLGWYRWPRWVWAPLPENPEEAANIVSSTVFGSGRDVIDMPRYFKPWDQGLPKLRDQLARLDDIRYLSKGQKQSLRTRMSERGLAADERNALILWGGSRHVLAMVDPA